MTIPAAADGDTGYVSPQSLDEFYERTYPRLVATMTLLTGSRAEAEEIAQEAFVRLIQRWEAVRHYEDPEGWLRTAARRLATSRWRRTVVAAKALPILAFGSRSAEQADSGHAGVELDIDTTRWLARLSPAHREVLVLHHALDMSIEQIAAELGISPGTVKSRLHRARAAARVEAPDPTNRERGDTR